jgi:hypothetical protein
MSSLNFECLFRLFREFLTLYKVSQSECLSSQHPERRSQQLITQASPRNTIFNWFMKEFSHYKISGVNGLKSARFSRLLDESQLSVCKTLYGLIPRFAGATHEL